jgi:hypothetical protein
VTSEKPIKSSKRKNNADIIGVTKVTPRAIAYAAVQVSPRASCHMSHTLIQCYIEARMNLSDKEEWNEFDGSFSYRNFYESIISVFEVDPTLPWVKDTLRWWNQ